MSGWRGVALVAVAAVAGATASLLVGAVAGMHGGDLAHLALLLLPAAVATVVAMSVVRPLLARAPIRLGLVSVAAIAGVVCLANLSVLALQMFVSGHDAVTVGVLLVYSLGAGVGAAVVIGRTTSRAVEHLADTARSLGEGELGARVGPIEGGPELATLGEALDEMAGRLQETVRRIHDVEGRRRDLITAVSHDLRTPLASLRAVVEAIDDDVVDDRATLHTYVSQMRVAVDTLVSLTDDLFELAQLDAGAIDQERRRVHLEDLVRSARAACERQAATKGLAVQTRLNGTGDTECSPHLSRVLQNLLQNAIRHTPADGTVTVEARRTGDEVCIEVADTGEGIPPDALPRVFDPFFRADPARQGTGAGLGLALAKRIVEALGGRIEAESEPRQGARFRVLLPASA